MSEEKTSLPVFEYNSFTTSCKECVFAKREDNKQVGCEFNRLEKFAVNGGVHDVTEEIMSIKEIVEKGYCAFEDFFQEEYDKGFAVVRVKDGKFGGLLSNVTDIKPDFTTTHHCEIPRYCDRCRNGEWKERNGGKSIEELKEVVNKEVEFKITVVVNIGPSDAWNQFEKCCESIAKQTFKVTELMVIDNGSSFDRGKVIDYLRNYNIDHYRYIKPLIQNKDLGVVEAYRNGKGKWIIEIQNCNEINGYLCEELNLALNFRLERMILWNINKNIRAVQRKTILTYTYDGIEAKAKKENAEHLIKGSLC